MSLSLLVSFIIALLIVGLVLYLVRLAPIDDWIKQVIVAVVVVAVIIYILQLLVGGAPLLKLH